MSPQESCLFSWFDRHPGGHWLVAWGFFSILLVACLAPLVGATTGSPAIPARRAVRQRILASNTFFILAVILVFVAFRWPLWLTGPLENPDEAELIAGAITLRDGGLPWKNLDCHTSGPLNAYALLLTVPLGLPLDYVGARVIATLLQVAAVLALWGTARRFFPAWIARLAVLPAINLWACRWFHDVVQYSSELPSVFLLALAGWIGACALATSRPHLRLWLLAISGAFATTAPVLAKLQSAPLSAALGLVLLSAIWVGTGNAESPQHSLRIRILGTAAFALGAILPSVALFSYLWIYGLIDQFLIFFWDSNTLYTAMRRYAIGDSPEAFLTILIQIRGCAAAVLGTLAFGAFALVPTLASHATRYRLVAAWILVAAAAVSIVGAGRYAQHYLHFLVIPLSWLAAVSLAGLNNRLQQPVHSLRHPSGALAAAFLLLTTAWPVWQTDIQQRPLTGYIAGWRVRQVSRAGAQLRTLATPGDKLAVWGWAPGLHVESGLGSGIRGAQCERLINPGPLQADYRHRFLFDLRRNRPRWFVDAVAPGQFGYRDRSLFGHETWPELRELIERNYERVAETDGVRIYRRRD